MPFEGKHGEEGTTLLMQSGLVNYFVFEQLDENRKKFENISQEDLEKEIKSSDRYYTNFKNYLSKSGLFFNLGNQKETILFYLHAEFVRQLFDETTYFQILLKKDEMIKKALKQ